jgi:hypothetical protein
MTYMTAFHKAASVHCHKFLRAEKFGRYRSTSRKEKTKVREKKNDKKKKKKKKKGLKI